ncbi:Uncharacterized protein C19C2.10 [Golovinomyces cichoracearum]|uniref:Uncharacterized protein C19C2.10 n=1 Tax=Golovinomyces cichoracearum TaxID=62708 RepID=A0A420HL15_9PEZI|nr:Uncharacterized protein C19C2.10 [Golovinomyces cichoracearum]
MNINKRFDRVKQWAGEKMGAESKTNVSDQFKNLETEINLRHEGTERLHKSMTVYVKSLSTRTECEDKEKRLPVGYAGQMMIQHGEDFDPDSEFGRCLINMGRANERVARYQESYVVNATNGWLESLERSLAMMKEYQAARKKLENRRLAYDASLSKMQKSKKEDFRVEEELRSQKAKYEESSEDVLRRMQDIKEAEADSLADLGQFLDAEIEYYDRCRDELHQLKKDWPDSTERVSRRLTPRSNIVMAHTYSERIAAHEEVSQTLEPEPRKSIRSQTRLSSAARTGNTRANSHDDYSEDDINPTTRRVNTTPSHRNPRESTPNKFCQNSEVAALRAGLRPTNHGNSERQDVFGDPSDESTMNSTSPERSRGERSVSPATSHDSSASRTRRARPCSTPNGRKGPPPPPPNRYKKPPPPPVKRADILAPGQRY